MLTEKEVDDIANKYRNAKKLRWNEAADGILKPHLLRITVPSAGDEAAVRIILDNADHLIDALSWYKAKAQHLEALLSGELVMARRNENAY